MIARADLGFGKAAKEGEHRGSGRIGEVCGAALGASLAGIKARQLGPCRSRGGHGAEEARRRQLEDARALVRHRGGRGDRASSAQYPQVDVALCVPAILIERAARAVPGFRDRRPGRPSGREGRPHRLHFGADAARRGCRLTIVGHSERRDAQRESDADVKAKARRRCRSGLTSSCASARAWKSASRRGCAHGLVAARCFAARQPGEQRRSWPSPTSHLGDRDRQDPDIGRNRGNARGNPRQACVERFRRGRRAGAHSLWRLGQSLQRGGNLRHSRRRRRARRGSQPECRRLHSRLSRLRLTRAEPVAVQQPITKMP